MFTKLPFNGAGQAPGTAKTSRAGAAQVKLRAAQAGTCSDPRPGPDPNNPKALAIQHLADGLGVTLPQLMAAFDTAQSHGVQDLNDPHMAAQLASVLGKDPARVQQLIDQMTAALRANQPQAASARK
jgi:hypothetical protein